MSAVEEGTEEMAPNILAMSDEEFSALDEPEDFLAPPDIEAAPGQELAEDSVDEVEALAETAEDTEPDSDDTDDAAETESDTDLEPEGVAQDATEADTPQDTSDSATQLAQIFAPFKANGKMMSVDSPEDAIQLMQMGANYNRKMHDMKPAMAALKMLQKNDLMEPGKLGFLVDLDRKDPAAISKLLKDSGIDPLQIDPQQGDEYQAPDVSVGDTEINLDTALDELKTSPRYDQVLNVVTDQWDTESQGIVANNPHLLKDIDAQIASGVYEQISTEMAREQALGRLQGMSDIEAYKATGDAIEAKGGFAQGDTPQDAAPLKEALKQPKVDKKRDAKRRAASPTKKSAPVANDTQGYSPLSMSDDQFMAQVNAKFL
jgi:hypothetical protein